MPILKYDGSPAAETAAPVNGLYGTSATETLVGGDGADQLWGGEGDLLIGGRGDDTYYVRASGDRLVEQAAEGADRIVAWKSITLESYANIENVSVSGDGLYVAGNALDNIVEGGSGAQQVYGGAGQDVLIGGAGADVFIVYKGEGNDVIQDFSAAEDKVRLKAGFTSFSEVQSRLSQVGSDVKLDLGGGEGLIFRNLTVGQLTAGNFQLELKASALGAQTFADEFNALSLWDAESAPNGVWRTDYGYQGAQGVGSYTLVSNDEKQIYTSPYFRDHAGDFAESPFSVSGGVLSITARPSTNPELFGYGYTSGLITTKPSFTQTYGYFEMRADLPDATGAWPAFWMLPADGSWPPELDIMEALTYDPHGAWTTQHSKATGSHVSNGQLSYVPDTADGFHTYGALWGPSEIVWYVDNVEVFRTNTPADMNKPMFMLANLALGGWGGAIDATDLPAEFKIDYIRAYALPGGETPPPTTPGYANSLFDLPETASWTRVMTGGKKADTLSGTSGADRLDGQAGADTLRGGLGDDTYVVDRAQDQVVEASGAGVDTVLSTSGSYTLASNVENLVLIGATSQTGVGNELNNRLVANDAGSTLNGGAGDDILIAGSGADLLTGGAGRDIFQFDAAPARAGRITDFTAGQDILDLRGLFAATGYAGSDPIADARLMLKASGADTQIWFDADGAGAQQAVLVTVLDGVAPQALTMQNDWFFR